MRCDRFLSNPLAATVVWTDEIVSGGNNGRATTAVIDWCLRRRPVRGEGGEQRACELVHLVPTKHEPAHRKGGQSRECDGEEDAAADAARVVRRECRPERTRFVCLPDLLRAGRVLGARRRVRYRAVVRRARGWCRRRPRSGGRWRLCLGLGLGGLLLLLLVLLLLLFLPRRSGAGCSRDLLDVLRDGRRRCERSR
jgi:hypothetical protein